MLKIWGRLSSINVRKVVWAAQEAGVPFERVDAGMAFGIVDTPAYRAHNPNALVPLIDDGGFVLWESNAIVRYLLARYAPDRLYPDDLCQRFDAERWMDWQQTTLNRAGGPAFVQWIRTPPERRDHTAIAASVTATEPLLAMIDAQLTRQPHMAGEHFGMADIVIACEIHRWWGLPQPRPATPHIDAWYRRMQERPAATVLSLELS
ncbi:glutathione S-transferase family protein [Hydrogenophaga sp. OTU3427]|uniref:glutathione S-transferase family protein n=1 Tax=Hydrogenophaga sp. OTU3427 TaxID=3043856 RepID=UPI00313C19FB